MKLQTTPPPADAASPGYLLIFRHTDWDDGLSTEQARQLMDKVTAWFDDLSQRGKIAGGHPLPETNAKVITGSKTGSPDRSAASTVTVHDGPYAESKEVVGGYLVLNAASLDEAVNLAKTNPLHALGLTTEVRQLVTECPIMKRVMQKLQSAEALA